MKKLFLVLLCLTATLAAGAQQLTYAAQSIGLPSVIAGNATTNVALTLDVRRQSTVALELTMLGGTAATTNAITLTFYQSVSGSTFASGNTYSTSAQTWVVYPNGTTATTLSTNLPVNGCGYLQLYSIASHASNGGISNVVMQYAVKTLAE